MIGGVRKIVVMIVFVAIRDCFAVGFSILLWSQLPMGISKRDWIKHDDGMVFS